MAGERGKKTTGAQGRLYQIPSKQLLWMCSSSAGYLDTYPAILKSVTAVLKSVVLLSVLLRSS